MKGQPVTSFERLFQLADERRAVLIPSWCGHRHLPASWVQNGSARYLRSLMNSNGIHEYIRK